MRLKPLEILKDFESKLKAAGKDIPRYVLMQLLRDLFSMPESKILLNEDVEFPDTAS